MGRSGSLRDEPTITELIAAREQADAGLRLAMPMLFDGIGPDPASDQVERLSIEDVPVTEVDDEVIGRAAAKVAHFRADAAADLKRLDKHAPRHIYVEALAVVSQMDDFLATVSDYMRGSDS